MNTQQAAQCMAELGHEKRLGIFRLLVKAGPEGLPVGVIGEELAIPGSTLSHHLSRLCTVNLVNKQAKGQTQFCRPNFQQLQALQDFLTAQCCVGTAGCQPEEK